MLEAGAVGTECHNFTATTCGGGDERNLRQTAKANLSYLADSLTFFATVLVKPASGRKAGLLRLGPTSQSKVWISARRSRPIADRLGNAATGGDRKKLARQLLIQIQFEKQTTIWISGTV